MYKYVPPSAEALKQLKAELGFSADNMARLSGLHDGSQWTKYTLTSVKNNRSMGLHISFMLAARLSLSADNIAKILATMNTFGANAELAELTLNDRRYPMNAIPQIPMLPFSDEQLHKYEAARETVSMLIGMYSHEIMRLEDEGLQDEVDALWVKVHSLGDMRSDMRVRDSETMDKILAEQGAILKKLMKELKESMDKEELSSNT